jgi:GNAT superfamily N-acetyltransferase
MVSIRAFEAKDIESADILLQQAFFQTESFQIQLNRCLAVQPDGWWAAELDGSLAGMVGAVRYGPVAYVGMMGVSPERQRLGVGTALMKHLVDDLEGRHGCRTMLLEATTAGEPLYTALGFRQEAVTVEFRRVSPLAQAELPVQSICAVKPEEIDALASLDARLFGADRRPLVRRLFDERPQHVLRAANGNGYLFAQLQILGPWAADSSTVAEELLVASGCLHGPAPWRVLVPAENTASMEILLRHGFTEYRRMAHMRKGKPWMQSDRRFTYGQASPAFG